MESEISNIIRSNDIESIQNQLKKNIVSQNDLIDYVDGKNNGEQGIIKNILSVYWYLLTMNLYDFLNQEYYQKNINNFLVISARGYLPLLRQKQDQISLVINSVSSDGLNALDYTLIDPKNVDVVSFLIVNQINVSPYALNKIEEYSISLEDKELLDYYQGLYTRLIPSDFRYLNQKINNKVYKIAY